MTGIAPRLSLSTLLSVLIVASIQTALAAQISRRESISVIVGGAAGIAIIYALVAGYVMLICHHPREVPAAGWRIAVVTGAVALTPQLLMAVLPHGWFPSILFLWPIVILVLGLLLLELDFENVLLATPVLIFGVLLLTYLMMRVVQDLCH